MKIELIAAIGVAFACLPVASFAGVDPMEAKVLLGDIRRVLHPGDALLLGTDLKKEARILEAAYDDPLGVTAAFNLNLLRRINDEFGADFEIGNFRHRAVWNEALGRIEMHIVSLTDQRIAIRDLDLTVSFKKDESIHTENSYKFDFDQISEMAAGAGFSQFRSWTDGGERFACNLWVVE